ncbi:MULTISPECIES: RNA polymerase sigma factor [Algibacter]|uniref:RNA polymerase sigma factor n=1 Tax=Algibacter lectus TaxID=221126 RepID=A0A090VGZ7_9FLAO|nr:MULTISPECIES: sigma-70 family RNA polymerase sigma factor [Algibacter]MDO7137694.1 sigma-70 family RNA polymerase sigma factor [Algibacter lectus]MWW25577.1 sigma-70 family RNA polymerase sigma factor [Algibacter lectus]TDY61524.1 RNA polymerase ECF family sigma subunit [Algibacter lectus]SFD12724.1 RNA polymerase, sigma subunit, ECF family [Algibacter lectus]GAL64025.1 RNA polymerase sigma-24 subunit [Algibacter lectus]
MEEQDFINDLRAGKQFAYGKLLDLFQQKVFATCISFVPNKEDAEDIAQDVFVEVFNSINKFKGNSKLSTWIYRITTNKCLEFIRKKNTKKRFAFLQSIMGNEIPMDKTKYFTEMNHPGVLLENKQKSETLFKAINQLPDAQRVVFTLSKIDGLSNQEVCDITEKSLSSVESLMFRAKKNLQDVLGDFYKNDMK